ncbi:MAG TPA: YwqG family protein [Phenylobacterium sp.]|nr:YwqG family protein [Phenylobacterium sp.]
MVTEALEARLRHLLRPTLLLVPAKTPGFSKLGGEPELPINLKWPSGHQRPRTFLAQIDLAAVQLHAPMDWLPKEGRLYAFRDSDALDDPEGVRILYSAEPAGFAVSAPPQAGRPYPERRVEFEVFTSAPSLDWLGLDAADLGLDAQDFQALEDLAHAPPPDETQHRIGGYPNEIQPERMWLSCEHRAQALPDPIWGQDVPPAIEHAAKEWRLLLQIDSDPQLKMNFGDGGRLYVFIRDRHARAGDFANTVTLWQTY